MAEYKFGVLPEEENEDQLVTEEEQEYKFGQPLEPREQDPLTKDVKSRSDEPLLQPQDFQKIPQYFKQAGIDLVKQVSGIPGNIFNSLKAQAYDDLLKDLEAELDTSEDTNSFKNKLARDRIIGFGFIRSEIEKDVGLKRSFFGSGDRALIKKSREELQAVREKTQKDFIEWRDNWEKEHKEERALQQKRYKEAGFTSRTDQTITGAITSIGLVAPSLIAAYATKKPSLAYSSLPLFGTLTYGEVFEDSIARGLSIEDATVNAKIQATSEVVTELAPTRVFAKGINIFNKGPGNDYVKKILNNGAHAFIADATGEQVNTLIQSSSNAYFDNQDELRVAYDNMNNPFYEGRKVHEIVGENMAHTLLATTIAGGTITGINTAIQLSPQMQSAIKNKGEQEGQQILDELSNLVTNKDMTKIALDKASARLNTPELKNNKNLDPMQIIAEELLKIDYVGKTEVPITEDMSFEQEVKTKFNKPEEKKPDYQFGAAEQLVTMPRKEAGKLTSEIDLDTGNIKETINKTQKNIELSLPVTSPLNIQTIKDDAYDFNEVNLVENYIIDSRKFDPEIFNDLPVRFSDTNLYRVRDLELEEKSNVAKAFIDINKAGIPMDIFSDLQFIGAHVKDDRFKDYTPALGVYMPQMQGISLSPITGLGNLSFENQLGAKIQLRDTFIHELGHHIDFTIGKDLSVQDKNIFTPVTAQSPLFDIPNMTFENGVMNIDENSGGPVIREALQILQGSLNTPEDYYGGNMLSYPLGELIANGDQLMPGAAKAIKSETFAQMYDLYNTNRELVREKAPITSKLIEDLNDAISADGTRAKNEGVQRVFRSPSAKRSYEVPDRGAVTEQAEISPEEQRARPRVEEPTREDDRDDIRPEISRIIGGPPGVDNQRKVGALRRKVKKLVEAGENNRFWYEESSKAILDITQGNIEDADKLAQAIAITSPRTNVDVNFTFALQAYYQWKSGSPIETGIYPAQMGPKLEKAFAGQDWEGKKTNNFYNNLMRVIDPSKAQGVTVDMWMARMFGYKKPTGEKKDTVGPAQYDFVAKEIQKITDELGWEPQQVQAAAWVAEKSRAEGKELEDAGFSYATAAAKNLVQISTETIPGRTNNHMNEMLEAPYEQVQEYHVNAAAAILDNDGTDIIAKRLDLLSPGIFESPGYFEEKLSPGSQTQVVAPKERKTKEFVIQKEAEDLIKAYAVAYGILFKQDAVGYHKPFFQKNIAKSKRNFHEIRIGRSITNEEIVALAKSMANISGKNYLNPIPTPTGVAFINFAEGDGVNNIQFEKLVGRVINDVKLADNVEVIQSAAALGYLNNNWSKSKNGEDYIQTSLAGRPDLQQRVRDIVRELQPRIDEVDQTFSEKYGWTRDESINSDYRDPELPERRIESRPSTTTEPAYMALTRGDIFEATSFEEYYNNLGEQIPNAFVMRMPIDAYLRLTTPNQDYINKIKKEVSEGYEKGYKFGKFDPAKVDDSRYPISLSINRLGKVRSHEGRHRAALVELEGAETIPVVIKLQERPMPLALDTPMNEINNPMDLGIIRLKNQYKTDYDFSLTGKDVAMVRRLNFREDIDNAVRVANIPDTPFGEEIARRPEDLDLDLSFEITKPPAPPGKPPSENYEWTSGDELNANLMLQKFLTKIQNQYERQVVLEEVIEDQLGMGILKDLDLSVVDKTDLMKSIVGDRMLKVSEEMETTLEEMFGLADNSYANINEFLYNLHAPERNKYIYQERRAKVDAAIEKYGDNPTPAQKGQITRLTNLAKPFIDNGSGIKTEEAIETLKEKYGIEYNNKNDSIKAINETGKKYLKVSELANSFIQGTRDVYTKGGLVSEENIDDWSDRYKYYVPLSGFAADTNVDGLPNRKGKGLSVYGLEVPKAKGRTSMAGDPIIQMYKQRENAVVRDEKNSVVKTLADQARTFKNPAVYETLDKVPKEAKQRPEWDPIRQSAYVFFKEDGKQKSVVIRDERLARAIQHLDTQGMNSVLQTIAIATRFMSVMNTGYNPDFIFPNFARDGYAATASALGEQSTKGGRIYGSKIVWKSMKNVFPRLGELYTYYRKGPEAIKDPGARKMIETYHAMGAKTSYFEFLDTDKLTKNFTALSKYRAGKISAQDLKRNTLDLVGDINNAIENGWRYSQFTEYVKQVGGIDNVSQTNLRRAAVQAKNASVNFDRRGEWGQEIGALLMFFNPAVQGTVQFMRGQNIFTKRGRKRLQPQKLALSLGAASLGMLYTMYNILMSGEDEDGELIYKKIPEFERNRNMLLVMPDEINIKSGEGLTVKKFGEDKKYMKGDNPFAISIPLSYGYNTHFNMGRLFIETQAHKIFPEKFDSPITSVEQAGYELADGFITSFSPISPIDTSATGIDGLVQRSRAFAPSPVIRPLLDIAANETYFGGPITKEDFPFSPKEPGFQKAFRGTEQGYVDLTKALNEMSGGNDYRSGWLDLDPNQLKYFVDYHLGGAGRTFTRVADLPRKIKEDIVTLEDISVIRSFVAQPRTYVNGQQYYDRKDEIESLTYEYKNLDPKQKAEFKKKENMSIVKLGDYMSPLEKKIFNKRSERVKDATRPALLQAEKDLKKVRDKMETAKNLYQVKNPDKHSELQKKYDEEIQEIYQRFNKEYNKAKSKG